ncbi:TPA: hypothetical protein ACGPVX_004053, partial [Escherichia coli]
MLTKNDVIQKAIDLFEGNESAALNWCNEPNRALQWKASCSGQQKLATALEFFQYRFSDSFGGNPPLYSCGLS